jgi:hypothetical protein
MATIEKQRYYRREIEDAMRTYYDTLSEKDRRRYVAVEALKFGWGGQSYLASVVGCSRRTVANGIADLQLLSAGEPDSEGIRRNGGGRKPMTETEPQLATNFF